MLTLVKDDIDGNDYLFLICVTHHVQPQPHEVFRLFTVRHAACGGKGPPPSHGCFKWRQQTQYDIHLLLLHLPSHRRWDSQHLELCQHSSLCPCYTFFTVLTLWASSCSSCSMGSSPGWPDSQKKNVLLGFNAVWLTFRMSHQLNLSLLSHSLSVLLGDPEPTLLLKKTKKKSSLALGCYFTTSHGTDLPLLC